MSAPRVLKDSRVIRVRTETKEIKVTQEIRVRKVQLAQLALV